MGQKLVDVFELGKRPFRHLIHKQQWTFKLDNLDRHSLPHSKVFALKCNRLTDAHLSPSDARDGFFVCPTGGLSVYSNIANEIEADLSRGVDYRFENDGRHLKVNAHYVGDQDTGHAPKDLEQNAQGR